MTKVEFFGSMEEAMQRLEEARKAADARVEPWQADARPGDCFVYFDEDLVIFGEVLECYGEPRVQHYRFCRCYSEPVKESKSTAIGCTSDDLASGGSEWPPSVAILAGAPVRAAPLDGFLRRSRARRADSGRFSALSR